MYLPRITEDATIKNAVMEADLAIFLFDALSWSPTRPRNTGIFAMGFIIAKKPVNTVMENVKRSDMFENDLC